MVAEWQDASYREQKDEASENDRGVPIFSPLCAPDYMAALKQNENKQDLRWGVPKVPPVTPTRPAHPQVFQFDDSASAQGYSLDPSYAQRAAVPSRLLPQDTLSPPLALYHRMKAAELSALGSFRNIEATGKRLPYIKPGDQAW